jgi:O-antigen/teichoic acid export membrane protein
MKGGIQHVSTGGIRIVITAEPPPGNVPPGNARPSNRTARYISNVIWNGASAAVILAVGFVLSPFMLRHLGDSNYGEWSLVLGLVEYYWLIDLGFRSAMIKFAAEFGALQDQEQMNALLSTGLVASTVMGIVVAAIAVFAAPLVARTWNVPGPEFPALLRIVGVSWALGMVFNVFGGALEGLQRFDLLSRVWMMTSVTRCAAVVIALKLGYGVTALGWALFGSQMLGYAATYVVFRRVSPEARIGWSGATRKMSRRMANYGVHTLTALVGTRLLSYSTVAIIPYFLPIRYLAYWAMPVKIMEYAFDGISRIGMITAPNAAEFAAHGRWKQLTELGVHTNRYCAALFAPISAVLLIYGKDLYTLWTRRPEFVAQSAFLVPILIGGYTVVSGQFNSVSILYGLGRHKTYVRCLLVESILTAGGLILVVPRFGLRGAAWLIAILTTLDRGVVACVLTARELHIHPLRYALRIYTRPWLLGAGMAAALWLIRRTWLAGITWTQAILAIALAGIPYGLLTFAWVLAPYHREQLLLRIRTLIGVRAG